MRQRPVHALIVALLLLGTTAAAVSRTAEAAQDSQPCGTTGGTLRVVYATEPKNLHPQIDSGTEGLYVQAQIRDSLVNIASDGSIVPGLAEELPEQPDDVTFIFHLRQGVTFHDGTTFDADDVVWTFDRLLGKFPELQSTQATRFQGQIASVEKLDQSTVKIVLSKPWADFLPLMANDKYMDIMSREAEEAAGKEYGLSSAVGTGPFKFKEWTKGDRLTLVRNENYWGDPPCMDEIVYKAIPDEATRMVALQAGEIDIMFDPALKDVQDYESDANYNVQTVDSGDMKTLWFNTTKPQFSDVRVRQALAYGIDRQEIVDSIYYGYAVVAQDLLPPWNPAHNPAKTYYPYDAEKAQQLLAEAGYDQGNPLEFELVTSDVTEYADMAVLIQAQLERIGVKVTVLPLDTSAFTSKTFPQQGQANPGFEAALYRLKFHVSTTDYTWRVYHPNTALNQSGYNQPGGAQNPEVTKLLDEAAQTVDPAAQRELYTMLADSINNDMPLLRIAFQKNVNISRAEVKNLGITVLDFMPLKNVWIERA